jgi:hypothetical protein
MTHAANLALRRVCEGYVEPEPRTHEAADDLWCRIVAKGRIVGRAHDGSRDAHLRVNLTLVEHPTLDPREVYALFGMGFGVVSVYRCLPEDARLALTDPGCFNL